MDLGTAWTRIAVRGRGIVLEEPTVVAIQGGAHGREVVSIGTAAREMLGRTPAGIEVIRPLRGGVVADFEATEQFLHHLLRRAVGRTLLRPRVVVCVPFETTEVERRAVQESIRSAGGRDVTLVPKPIAGALGAALRITEPVGSMIVDVGAGQTEVAVISLGGAVVSRSVRVAGDAMNDAISHWLRSRENLVVGDQTAETVKVELGCADPIDPPVSLRIRGRDLATGRPREVELTSDQVCAAIAEPVARIRDAVLATLGETPPELSADLVDRGIILCGGSSRLRHLDRVLRRAVDLPILSAERPEQCVVTGAARLLDDGDLLGRVALGA